MNILYFSLKINQKRNWKQSNHSNIITKKTIEITVKYSKVWEIPGRKKQEFTGKFFENS